MMIKTGLQIKSMRHLSRCYLSIVMATTYAVMQGVLYSLYSRYVTTRTSTIKNNIHSECIVDYIHDN